MYCLINWINFFVILFLSSGCSTLNLAGKPPKVDIVLLDVAENPNKTWRVQGRAKNQNGVKYDVPVSEMDKMVCTYPDQFVDMMTYIGKIMSAFKSELEKTK